MKHALRWIDLLLFFGLLALAVYVIRCRPWSFSSTDASTLAGALIGGAAVLLGNFINRLHTITESEAAARLRVANLKTLIAGELVNVTAGLLDSKTLVDSAIGQINAGGPPPGQIDLTKYAPRPMPFTDGLGEKLLELDQKSVDAIVTLRSNLSETRRTMHEEATLARATMGLSLTTATKLSNAVAHDLSVLIVAFEHIAPTRKLAIGDAPPELVTAILKRAKEARA